MSSDTRGVTPKVERVTSVEEVFEQFSTRIPSQPQLSCTRVYHQNPVELFTKNRTPITRINKSLFQSPSEAELLPHLKSALGRASCFEKRVWV